MTYLVGHGGCCADGEFRVVLGSRASLRTTGAAQAPPLPGSPAELTMLTPPELSALHMPSTGARPTVVPWKVRPLGVSEQGVTGWSGEEGPLRHPRVSKGHPREQLRRVVWPPSPEPTTPVQESPEGCVCVLRDAAVILFRPYFQASQYHLNIQRPENLRQRPAETRIRHPLCQGQGFSIATLLPFGALTTQPGPHNWQLPGGAVLCGSSSGAGLRTGKAEIPGSHGLSRLQASPVRPLRSLCSPGCGQPLCTVPGTWGSRGPLASPGRGKW